MFAEEWQQCPHLTALCCGAYPYNHVERHAHNSMQQRMEVEFLIKQLV